ncbi:hypothetical protein PPERSA_09242 [Pseudocohnilembus persalinus]|uniref:Uncharacterized protein n=1 Tax=Pseudocohnilembus persalinus TaxID=266149 RepID=A0A0V0QLW5_PSEPJ|nr:hypothetical protein PPERSA_09242 [Pseudocohnilembus persalinus]|eukprot:KRX03230.1 hypothetical protein PPERSA_09242 [Pseudocohnilembus persalinus]
MPIQSFEQKKEENCEYLQQLNIQLRQNKSKDQISNQNTEQIQQQYENIKNSQQNQFQIFDGGNNNKKIKQQNPTIVQDIKKTENLKDQNKKKDLDKHEQNKNKKRNLLQFHSQSNSNSIGLIKIEEKSRPHVKYTEKGFIDPEFLEKVKDEKKKPVIDYNSQIKCQLIEGKEYVIQKQSCYKCHFQNCDFQSSVYSTMYTHYRRRHQTLLKLTSK